MAIQVIRFQTSGGVAWGVNIDGKVTTLEGNWATTGAFLTDGGADAAWSIDPGTDGEDLSRLRVLCPVTSDRDIVCLGMNYASHLRELGRDPAKATHNIIFHKASSSLCAAGDQVIKPRHVRALDYEIELGLVIGRHVTGPIEIDEDTLHEYVGGLVITNDISARDVQLSHEQFCKAKSYRTFAPTGPFLVLLTKQEMTRWRELVLTLSVNDERRQQAPASDMVHGPIETLRELAEIRDLRPGDLVATGTPGGVALKAPSKLKATLAMMLSPSRRAAIVARMADKDPAYLRSGDVITSTIATPDGAIDLGRQRNEVVDATR